VKTGQPLLLTGQVRDQRFTGNDPTIGESIVAPLRTDDRTIGVVNIKHSAAAKDRFTQASIDSLQQVAGDIAASFVAADAMRRTEDDRKQALVLYELSRLATMGNDPQEDLDTRRGDDRRHAGQRRRRRLGARDERRSPPARRAWLSGAPSDGHPPRWASGRR